MSADELSNICERYYPVDFLEELQEKLGAKVKLGKATAVSLADANITKIEIHVIANNQEYGTYKILTDNGLTNLLGLFYSGNYPNLGMINLIAQNYEQRVGVRREGLLMRYDTYHHEIQFPGIERIYILPSETVQDLSPLGLRDMFRG